jgi:hypothetical protein
MHDGLIGRFVFATLLAALGTASPAAAVDLSGDYVVTVPIPCRVTTVQTGTAFQTTGSCDFMGTSTSFSLSGTVDPAGAQIWQPLRRTITMFSLPCRRRSMWPAWV